MFLGRKKIITLFLGDVALLYLTLFLVLVVRYIPVLNKELVSGIESHFLPFTILIGIWILVFTIAGLYDRSTLFFKKRLPMLVARTQAANAAIAVAFFYIIPFLNIAPKTNLFLYLFLSSIFILAWRFYGAEFIAGSKRQKAILVARGSDAYDLEREINSNSRYSVVFVASLNPQTSNTYSIIESILRMVERQKASIVVADMSDRRLEAIVPQLYALLFSGVVFIDINKVYEEVFEKVPLTLLHYQWFLENISPAVHGTYDFFKRGMDIALSILIGIPSLLLYPFVILAIKIDDGGPIFITQARIGQNHKIISIYKFRSMNANDRGRWLSREGERITDNRITRVGRLLRNLRIDEFPQLWNIIRGDLSLIGPRPDIIDLGKQLSEEIPYYNIRYVIKPGLSGWAQIKQDYAPLSVEESKDRLAYDLYYVKNRSFVLDLLIALRTIKIFFARSGR